MLGHVVNFLLKLYNQLRSRNDQSPPIAPPMQVNDQASLGRGGGHQEEQPNLEHEAHPPPGSRQDPEVNIHLQRRLFIVGICFAAVGIALQALQTPKPLPLSFHCCCMALEFSFAALLVSVYLCPCFKAQSVVLENVGVFFAATAFLLAITMNFSHTLVVISSAVYVLSLLIILFVNYRRTETRTMTVNSAG